MSKENQISKLSNDIRNQLKNNQEKLEQYEQILQKFAGNQISSIILEKSLCALFQGNSKMINRISEALKSQILEEDAVMSYFQLIQFIKSNFISSNGQIPSDKLEIFQYITLIVHLAIQEFLPLTFIIAKIESIQKLLPKSFDKKFSEYVHRIAPIPHSSRIFINDIYLSSNNSTVQNKYFIKSSVKPTEPMQFMTIAHLQVTSPIHLQSLIRCLTYFGFGFIDDKYAFNWINSIDPMLSEFFDCCQEANKPHLFHPSQIYKQIIESNMSNDQIQWIFGRMIFDYLSNTPTMNGEDLMESASKSELSSSIKQNFSEIESTIPEMKSVTFFNSMKIIINFIRNASPLNGIEESLKAVYGESSPSLAEIGNNVGFLLKFYERIKTIGGFAQKKFEYLAKQKMNKIDVGSKDWRFAYWPLTRKSFFIRSIVFNGYKRNNLNKEVENSVYYFLNSFVKRFESIANSFKFFKGMMQNEGSFWALDGVALSIVYFFELATMIEENDKMNKKQLEELASLVFASEPPIQKYFGKTISNIDVLALNFVQCLQKIKKDEIKTSCDVSQFAGSVKSEFFYQIQITKDEVLITALPNNVFN